MVPFDRAYATLYWSAIVTIAVSCTIFEFLTTNDIVTLKSGVRGHSRSLKMVPFKSLGMVSYLPSMVTMAISLAISQIFSIKEWPDPEIGVWGRSRSL